MAFPVVATRATGRTTATNVTSHAITLPTGIAAGHLLVVLFSSDGAPTCTASAGWTKLGQASNTTVVTGAIFWKVAQGSDTLTVTTSVVEQSSHVSLRITGASSVTGSSANGSSSNSNPPSHTPAGGTKDYLWVASRSGDSTIVATAAPASFSNLQTLAGVGTASASSNTAERSLNGSVLDPGTFTSASEQWVAWTIAVHPATIETHSGTAATSATSAQTSAGTKGARGTPTLTGVFVPASVGRKSGSGGVQQAVLCSTISSGLTARAGNGEAGTVASLVTASTAARSGSTVHVLAAATTAATGSANRAGPAALAVAGDISVSGTPSKNGNVVLEGLVLPASSGTKYGGCTGSLSLVASLAGEGSQGFETFGSGAMVFPDDVANLVAWWHADDLALADNDPIPLVLDRIGDHDLAQATAGNRPLYKPVSGEFSKPAMLFDGTDDFLDAPFSAELNPVAFTFLAKVSVLSNPSGVRGVQSSRGFDTSFMTGYLIYAGVADDTWQAWLGQTGATEATTVDSTVTEATWTNLALRASSSQGCTLYVDGTPGTTGANFTAPNTASPFRIGAGASESPVGTFFTNMLLTEAFFYDRRLSDTEIEDLVAYLEAQHESGGATSSSAASTTAGGTSARSGSASLSAAAQADAQGAKGAIGDVAASATATASGSGDGIETPTGTGSVAASVVIAVLGSKSISGTGALALVAALAASGGQVEDAATSATLGDNTATSSLGNERSSTSTGGTLAATYADRTANP